MTAVSGSIRSLRIDPDGTISQSDCPAMMTAEAHDGPLTPHDVLTLRNPWYTPGADAMLVGVVHDFGRVNGEPLNVKAWALYGRSPICGPMWVGMDGGYPLPLELIEIITDQAFPIVAPVTTDLLAVMDRYLRNDAELDEPYPIDPGPLDAMRKAAEGG